MSESTFQSPDELNAELKRNPDLFIQMQKLWREKKPEFYENYDKLKQKETYLVLKDLNWKTKEKLQLELLKEAINNFKIMEEIYMTWTSSKLQEISFFHDHKSLEMLVTFYTSDTLDLSWLKKILKSDADILSRFNWKNLYLDWLQEIDDETFAELIKFKWNRLSLTWIKKLSQYQRSILKEKKCNIIDIPNL